MAATFGKKKKNESPHGQRVVSKSGLHGLLVRGGRLENRTPHNSMKPVAQKLQPGGGVEAALPGSSTCIHTVIGIVVIKWLINLRTAPPTADPVQRWLACGVNTYHTHTHANIYAGLHCHCLTTSVPNTCTATQVVATHGHVGQEEENTAAQTLSHN